jgi:hypothetical protein
MPLACFLMLFGFSEAGGHFDQVGAFISKHAQ